MLEFSSLANSLTSGLSLPCLSNDFKIEVSCLLPDVLFLRYGHVPLIVVDEEVQKSRVLAADLL